MGDEYDYEEASPEEKLRIASYFLMHSPNGEVDDVLRDVRKLVNSDNVLSRHNVEAILREYNRSQMVFAPSPKGDHNVMLCPTGELQQDVYYDPHDKVALKFDNFKRSWSVTKANLPSIPSNIESYRVAIEKEMEEYTAAVYFDQSRYSFAVFAERSGEITINISAKNINLPNYWSGGWRTTFTFNVGTQGRTPIKGCIRINVHYFEDGNVQLDSNFSREELVQIEDVQSTAQSIHAAIDTIETVFQTKLEEFYGDMHSHTFAAMRRFLPVTRNPMDWNPNAHKLAAQIKE